MKLRVTWSLSHEILESSHLFLDFNESCLKTLTWAFELRFKKPGFFIQNERPSEEALSLLRSTFLQNLVRSPTPLNAEKIPRRPCPRIEVHSCKIWLSLQLN